MIFACAVGQLHALQTPAQDFFVEANLSGTPLCTSAEVMQEWLEGSATDMADLARLVSVPQKADGAVGVIEYDAGHR